jgi:hypothetical protein
MATLKKSETKLKQAQNGTSADPRNRQGNSPKEETKSSPKINTGPRTELATPKVAEREQTFGQAFATNRKAGAKTFTWKGKSYSTATKEEATTKKSTSGRLPSTSSGYKPPESFSNRFSNQFNNVVDKAKSTPAAPAKSKASPPAKRIGLPPAKHGKTMKGKC